MKKVLVTRKLLKSNEERISKLWDAKLNLSNEIYSPNKLIELSADCDGILSSILDKIDQETINKFSNDKLVQLSINTFVTLPERAVVILLRNLTFSKLSSAL